MDANPRDRCFTLLELLVVITLMSIALGMTVFRFAGLTDASRLRSAAAQFEAVLRNAQSAARLSGTPRLIEYTTDGDHVIVRAPQVSDDTWMWNDGTTYDTATRVKIVRVLVEGRESRSGDRPAIRIMPNGGVSNHALVFTLHELWAVLVVRGWQELTFVPLDRKPNATSYELLLMETKNGNARNTT